MNKHRIVITNQDAKLVLSAYRPSGADVRDPFFEEALEQTKRDPELMEWFVKQLAFDDVIVSKLRTIESPAGLHSEILAGAAGHSRVSSFLWSLVGRGCGAFGCRDGSLVQRILRAIETRSARGVLFRLPRSVQSCSSIRLGKS